MEAIHSEKEDVRLDISEQRKKVVVIGAGFAGLSAACCLAQDGFDVTVLERHTEVGGRCRAWVKDGFTFDIGPSWYWMPDVFDEFFARFGRKPADFYELQRLDPSYRLFMENGRPLDIPDKVQEVEDLFEKLEPGSRENFRKFMDQSEYKYKIAMSDYVKRPSLLLSEFFDLKLIRESFRLHMFSSQASHVRKFFKNPDLIKIMEWPVLFLGGAPKTVPAMYSMMNYAAIVLGTWYPKGGLAQVPKGMEQLGREVGVSFKCGGEYEVRRMRVSDGSVEGVETTAGFFPADYVVAAGDYHHMEQDLLDKRSRGLTEEQWGRFTMSPSGLVFMLGVGRRVEGLRHHNLFFDESLDDHAYEIYDAPAWPSRPLFYVCVSSLSDPAAAPPGCENIFILVPLAAGLTDSDGMRDKYYDIVMDRLERYTGQGVREAVLVKRVMAMRDYEEEYRSYKGNAYGLANTLFQTAVFKPPIKSPIIDNLYFAGQLTVPGPGVPPALISGQMVADLIRDHARLARSGKKGGGGRGVCRAVVSVIGHVASCGMHAQCLGGRRRGALWAAAVAMAGLVVLLLVLIAFS